MIRVLGLSLRCHQPMGGARKEKLAHLIKPSLCCIQQEQREHGYPTLGLFRPAEITRLAIEPTDPDWTSRQKVAFSQQLLPFQASSGKPPEKIPCDFRYLFRCAESTCPGHRMTCFDSELGQSYRRWRREYGDGWEQKFRERYERDMISRFDTHFSVGTVHQHPGTWIIVGLFSASPRRPSALFNVKLASFFNTSPD
jgi:hypothetical protein